MSDRQVAEGEPQRTEQQHRREAHTLGKSTHDQTGRDGCESGLERCEDVLGNHHTLAEGGGHAVRGDALEEQLVQRANEWVARGERRAVAIQDPQHIDHRGDHKNLHQHRQHVLAADQAAIEQRQARDGHQNDEHGGHNHPGGVALVGHRCRRSGFSSGGCFSGGRRCCGRSGCGGCRSSGGGGGLCHCSHRTAKKGHAQPQGG